MGVIAAVRTGLRRLMASRGRSLWLIAFPLVLLALDLTLFHPQIFKSQRERQEVSINGLLTEQNQRLGSFKGHRIHASLDDITAVAPFSYLSDRQIGLVVSIYVDENEDGLRAAALVTALMAKLTHTAPADARKLIDLLAQKTALGAGDVLRFKLSEPRTRRADFPPDRIYLVLLTAGHVDKDELKKGLQKAIEYADDDGVGALVIPCLGRNWQDKNSIALAEFFASLFTSIPEGDAPDLYLSLYRNWPTFELEDAVRAINASWQAGFDTAEKSRPNFYRLELRAGLLLWALCLLACAFRTPLTFKSFLIISAAFGGLGVASHAGVALFSSAYPELGPWLGIVVQAVMAITFPAVVGWSAKDLFSPAKKHDD